MTIASGLVIYLQWLGEDWFFPQVALFPHIQ